MVTSVIKQTFYRRLYIAFLIDRGFNTMSQLIEKTSMHRRTIQNTILMLPEMDVIVVRKGAKNTGHYEISSWGAIDRNWVSNNILMLKETLKKPAKRV